MDNLKEHEMTIEAARMTAHFTVRDGSPQSVEAWFELDTVEAAQAFAAQFPKSVKVRATTLSRPIGGSYLNGSETVGYVTFQAGLVQNGVNGGVNETGLRRYAAFCKTLAALNVTPTWVRECRNSYADQAAFDAAVGR